jgi:RNA polymerase sigma-70 factor (family 1)
MRNRSVAKIFLQMTWNDTRAPQILCNRLSTGNTSRRANLAKLMGSDYQPYHEIELLRLVARGDERAFRTIYDRYWKRLFVLAFTRLRSREDAEEIIQTVFSNLWARRQTLEIRHSLPTYIAAVTKYEILKRLATQRKESLVSRNAFAKELEDCYSRNWLDYRQLVDQIEKTVQLLPDKCRLVFRLSRESGLTEKQIAETLNIAPKTVQAHLHKALKRLRTTLQQPGCFWVSIASIIGRHLLP